MNRSVVVVGASLGGLRAAEQLRAHGFDGELTVVGEEPYAPYNRPPLSKDALANDHGGAASSLHGSLAFRAKHSVGNVSWLLGIRVESASLATRTLVLSNGRTLPFDGLVAATGLRPRRIPHLEPARGRHVLRTIDDAVALRADFHAGQRVVVVGGGFIGCEVASTAHALGAEVTIVEPLSVPMVRGVGEDIGAALMRHQIGCGVAFITGQGVATLTPEESDPGRVGGVVLNDGTTLPADVVVESVGSHPNVEWLAGNGLDLSDGLLCDNHMRVEGRPNVAAVGDVARFPNPDFGVVARRVEHWSIPSDTARRAAQSLSAHLNGGPVDDSVFAPLPTFWSDQFGLHLQSFGAPGLADHVEVICGDLSDLASGVVASYHLGDRLIGVLLINVPTAQHAHYRSLVLPRPHLV